MTVRLDAERLDWLRQGYARWRIPELTERFNARFGHAVAPKWVKSTLCRHKIRCGRQPGLTTGERWVTWSPPMIAWLRRYRARLTIGEATDRLNARFGTQFKAHSVANACQKHGISAGSSGCFNAGGTPWNKGKHISNGGRSVDTQFRPGNRPHTCQPIGAYRQDSEGYWWLKYRDEQTAGMSRHNWIEVHKLTYLAAHGAIPSRHCVVFLDGDQDNCLDPTNLDAIPRAVLARVNQMGWSDTRDRDTRRAMIALARLTTEAHRTAREIGMTLTERRRAL